MPEGATGCDPAVAEEGMNALDQALADLVDDARKIGEWKAEPAPLTPRERGAWNLRIAELTAAEGNARQRIRPLFSDRPRPHQAFTSGDHQAHTRGLLGSVGRASRR